MIEIVVVLGMALGLSLLIKTFLVQAFFIPSESMNNTLLVGDRILVSKLTPGVFDLKRGDVIVFKDPDHWLGDEAAPPKVAGPRQSVRSALTFVGLLPQDSGEHLVKRLIGLPGDTVMCCDAQGQLTVNGVPVDERPYLKPGEVPSITAFKTVIRPGQVWAMGDNRSNSSDSRFHMSQPGGGQVPIANIVGKAFVIVWPFARAGGVNTPNSVFSAVPDRQPR